MSKIINYVNNLLENRKQVDEDIFSAFSTLKSSRQKNQAKALFKSTQNDVFMYMWDMFLIQVKQYKMQKKTKYVNYNSKFFNELMDTLKLDDSILAQLKKEYRTQLTALNRVYTGYNTGKITDSQLKQLLKENKLDPSGIYHKILKSASFYSVQKHFKENDVSSLLGKKETPKQVISGTEHTSNLANKIKNGMKKTGNGFLDGIESAVNKRPSK